MISNIYLNYLFVTVNTRDSLIKSLQMCERISPLYLISYAQHELQYNISVLLQLFKSQTRSNMQISKLGKQSQNKISLNKKTLGVQSSLDLASNKGNKKKSKNTIIIPKSSTIQINTIKSKSREKEKNVQTSFNEVVNKFKKLFDEKIKFVKDQTVPTTQRINFKPNKSSTYQTASDNKVKKIVSTVNLDRKNVNKQGFSELMSNIQAKLNMHKKKKQEEYESVEMSESPSAVLLDYMYKNKKKSLKSKQKIINKSKQKQKYRNISGNSGNLSTTKKTEKPATFQSIQQPNIQQRQKRIKSKSKQKSKSKTKINSSKSKKINQFLINDKVKGQTTIRQNYRSGNLSQAKYKSRLKTFESQNVGESIKGEKDLIKKRKDSKKQKKKQQGKIKLNMEKINQKQQKLKSRLSEKQKQSRSKSPISARFQQENREKKLKIQKYKLSDKNMKKQKKQIRFDNNQRYIVSSSSDMAANSEEQSDVLSENVRKLKQSDHKKENEQQQITNRRRIDRVQGSIITYDVGNEGQLKFSQKIIDTESQQEKDGINKTEREQQIMSQVQKLQECNIQCLVDYLVGFKDYVYFINRKKLIEQFQDNKSAPSNNKDSKQNSYKTPSTFGRVKQMDDKNQYEKKQSRAQKMQQVKQKESMKLQNVLRQQQIKWLDLKANLQRIKNIIINKKQDQCGEQLDKIIRQAEYNHLLLKSMEIKDIAHTNTKDFIKQKTQQMFDYKQKDRSNSREQKIKQSVPEQSSISCIKQYIHVEQLQSRSSDCIEHKQQGQSSILQQIPQLQTTVKAPMRTSPNQININININDNQIKIQSPNTNTKIVQNKVTNKKQIQYKNSATNKLDIIRNSPPKKSNIVKIIKQVNITDTITNKLQKKQQKQKGNTKQLSQSQLQLRILINQCKQEQSNNNKEKQKQKQSPINQVLEHIFQTKSNQHNFKSITYAQTQPQQQTNKAENVANNSSSSINSGYKKTKLSYDEAPLQIKKIFRNQNDIIKEVEHKSKQMSKKLLKADLDLSDFMSNQAHHSQNNSLEGDNINGQSRKIKILTQLKSPKNYKINANGVVSSHSSTGNFRGQKVNKNIKISLFSKQKDKQKINQLNRLYNSEGQLIIYENNGNIDQMNQQNSSAESKNSGSKNNITIERVKNKNNNNFIIFKEKNKNRSDKSIEINNNDYVSPPKQLQNISGNESNIKQTKQIAQHQQFIITTPQPASYPIPQPQNSSMLNSNAQQLKSSGSSKYKRRKIFQTQAQLQIQVQPKSKQKKFQVYKQLFPWLKPNSLQNIQSDEQTHAVQLKKFRSEEDRFLLQELSYKEDKGQPPFPSPVGRQIQASSFLTAQLAKRFQKGEEENQKLQFGEQNRKINKFILKKPKYVFSQIQECNQNVFQSVINEFILQLFEQNGYLRIGNHLVQYYNINNIEINSSDGPQKQKQLEIIKQPKRQTRRVNIQRAIQQNKHIFQANTMTNRQIDQFDEQEIQKQFQRCFQDQNVNQNNQGNQSENESNQRVDMSQYSLAIPEQKISKDSQYIISLALKLLNYIHEDEQKYQQFIKRLKKPLGVDSLTLLKLLRQNEEVDYQQQQQADAENENENQIENQVNIPEAEDVVDAYYVISLETLVQFEVQSSTSNSTSNQQFLNQALYDKINMILDTIRPFGTKGLPSINFIHRYKQLDKQTRKTKISNKFEQDYKQKFTKIGTFEEIKNFVIKQLCESLKIRLGLFSYDIESDRIIQFSFNKMINQYIYQLEQQWRSFNQGQFQVKHTILLALEDMIIDEEVRCLSQLLNKSDKLINY